MKSISKIIVLALFALCSCLVHAQDVFIASYNGDLETVGRMVEQNPELVKSRNSDGRFPLEMAAQTGKIDVVKFLLAKGADINMNRNGATALHMAALYGGNVELVSLLLEKGADINAREMLKKLAEFLLDKGGEINAGGHERFLCVTPDGQYLFFLRVSEGSDFFWVDAKIIEALR